MPTWVKSTGLRPRAFVLKRLVVQAVMTVVLEGAGLISPRRRHHVRLPFAGTTAYQEIPK
jgi:hypothetical protein